MSAGEPSGVNIAATLMRTLKERVEDISFAGIGGQAMIDEGMRLIYDPARNAAMWLWGNLRRIPEHVRALDACTADWERERPDVVITIDYQAFHLFVGTRARAMGIPVIHFVGSQFWARRYYTLEPIRRAYDHVLLIHEFEKPYYDEAGIDATYVGHPVFERLRGRTLDDDLIARLRTLPEPRIGLLPGSRRSEIVTNLPVMLKAVGRLKRGVHLVISCGRPDSRARIDRELKKSGMRGEVLDFGSGEIMKAVDVAVITSGTASLEAVYYGCPSVVIYRLSPLNYFFAKPHINCHIAQPNLIVRRKIMPEYLLKSGSGRRPARAIRRLLDHPEQRQEQRDEFARIKERLLTGPPPSEAAADVVMKIWLDTRKA